MKLLVAFLFCLFVMLNSWAQTRANTFSPQDLLVKTITFDPKKSVQSKTLPFSTFKVIDARFDTSKIGFITSSSMASTNRNYYEILKIKSGAARGLQNYLNENYAGKTSSAGYGLLFVLKKFWITSTPPHSDQKYNSSNTYQPESRIIVNWELYIYKDDQYLPFRKIDTALESMQTVKQLFKSDDGATANSKLTIYQLVNNLVEQLDYTKAINVFADRKTISLEEINASIEKRLSIPVLSDATIKKGVFINFDDFKKNNPAFEKFKEKKPVKGMRYIVDSTDSEIKRYWGYNADYMKVGRYGSETIFRAGNTFDFFEKVSHNYNGSVSVPGTSISGARIPVSTKTFDWTPYQVDMETGEFY